MPKVISGFESSLFRIKEILKNYLEAGTVLLNKKVTGILRI